MKGNEAVVASGHPLVSQAALEMLHAGGNAFDAVVAAGFTSTVAEPALTSLGGGGFLLAKTREDEEILFDFFADTPGRGLSPDTLEPHFFPVTVQFPGTDQDFNVGMGSVAVPGSLKGFIHIHNRLGSLPLARIVLPAIEAARHGVRVNRQQAYFLKLLYPIMTLTDTGKKIFEPDGQYLQQGDLLINHPLADFLEQLPEDQGADFYTGKIAETIAADMTRHRGLLTGKDLALYEIKERSPLKISYRNLTVLTNPPPSQGGSLITMALKILENIDFHDIPWGSLQYLDTIAKVMAAVEDKKNCPPAQLEEDWHDSIANEIRSFSRGTTQISVTDGTGNAASMTCSNGEGSGYIVPGTGIMLNNMMGEDDLHPDGFHSSPPGLRVASMMSPTLVLHNGIVRLVVGSGGSKRIRTAIMQVLTNIIDYKMTVAEAVNAPRIHWDGEILQVEPGFSPEILSSLKQYWPINEWSHQDVYFGGVNAVSGSQGYGDPRRGGDARTLSGD
ncbi:gamma-glutamyltransferase family protein [Thermodesulfobacteriota bacterium]